MAIGCVNSDMWNAVLSWVYEKDKLMRPSLQALPTVTTLSGTLGFREMVVMVPQTFYRMKNVVFWDIKTQFVPHRRHITSPLQSLAS
jgi:hypothetical protein